MRAATWSSPPSPPTPSAPIIEDLDFGKAAGPVTGTGNSLANHIIGSANDDKLDGREGDDLLDGGAGKDTLLGGTGNDFLVGNDGDDVLNGDAGNDVLSGNAGRDILNGGAGNDDLSGDDGDDIMIGGAGNDTYSVTDGGDVVQEAVNGGIDTIFTSVNLTLGANVENAVVTGGNTTVTGNDLNNVVAGGGGANSIAGGKGADTLFGQAGNDFVGGGDGNDVIEGGLGADQLNGGAGNDLFLYRLDSQADLANLGGDLIIGFEAGKDKIDLVDLFSGFRNRVGRRDRRRLLEDRGGRREHHPQLRQRRRRQWLRHAGDPAGSHQSRLERPALSVAIHRVAMRPLRHRGTNVRRYNGNRAKRAMHDRSHCVALVFTHSCSCDVGHTRLSDNPIASCILTCAAQKFLKRNMNRHHPRRDRAGSASMSSRHYAVRGSAHGDVDDRHDHVDQVFEWAACPPSCRSLPVMPDRRTLGIREFDRADAHG